jgi:hypothetical protein
MIRKMRFHLSIFEGEVAKGEEADGKALAIAMDKAAEAARDAAPYVHPRLAAVQHTGADNGPITHTVSVSAKEELIRRFAEIAARVHATEGDEAQP